MMFDKKIMKACFYILKNFLIMIILIYINSKYKHACIIFIFLSQG